MFGLGACVPLVIPGMYKAVVGLGHMLHYESHICTVLSQELGREAGNFLVVKLEQLSDKDARWWGSIHGSVRFCNVL